MHRFAFQNKGFVFRFSLRTGGGFVSISSMRPGDSNDSRSSSMVWLLMRTGGDIVPSSLMRTGGGHVSKSSLRTGGGVVSRFSQCPVSLYAHSPSFLDIIGQTKSTVNLLAKSIPNRVGVWHILRGRISVENTDNHPRTYV